MNDVVTPKTINPPFSQYAHGVAVPAGARWLAISGQVGVGPDGALAPTPEGQIDQAFANLLAVLDEGGMTVADIVHVNLYLTRSDLTVATREARDAAFGGHLAGSTLIIVAGLAHPDWVFEVEALAAKAD